MIKNHSQIDCINLGGTLRNCSVEETLTRLKPLHSQLGITRVANITGLDAIGIPVALCVRPNAKHLATSQGKGLTWELAQVSAVMESIEGFHAENPRQPELRGCYVELATEYLLADPHLFVPGFFHAAYSDNYPLDWIAGINIATGEKVFFPHVLICLDSTKVHPEYSLFTVSSNGLAAGNTLEEAICHGLYEIIERDCLARWGKLLSSERLLTQINTDTIDQDSNQKLIAKFHEHNIQVKIWDISSDELAVPAFHCAIRDKNILNNTDTFRGTGAHLCREIALSRALTEAAQSRLTVISGARDDVFLDQYQQSSSAGRVDDTVQGVRDYKKCILPDVPSSFTTIISDLTKSIVKAGFKQVLVYEHTRTDIGIPVVHVFVPGMQFNGNRI